MYRQITGTITESQTDLLLFLCGYLFPRFPNALRTGSITRRFIGMRAAASSDTRKRDNEEQTEKETLRCSKLKQKRFF